jgi:hypothetical protein
MQTIMSSNNKPLKEQLSILRALGNLPNLEGQSAEYLREFSRVLVSDPQACYDLLFATPRQKSKVVRLLAEYATKKALEQHARACGDEAEANKLLAECVAIYEQLPPQARWATNNNVY